MWQQNKTNGKPVIRVCAWCERGQLYFKKLVDITHGICETHLSAMRTDVAMWQRNATNKTESK